MSVGKLRVMKLDGDLEDMEWSAEEWHWQVLDVDGANLCVCDDEVNARAIADAINIIAENATK